ncbi:MAG TPA: PHB depolymerase family esterase [Polyangiaceae bacterium]|nr:PHB depolymerase family esterase [Polyangiaceae bacterium]
MPSKPSQSTPVRGAPSASAPEPHAAPARLTRRAYQSAATGAERDYFVYLPAGYDSEPASSWPLLVVLHGDGERGNAKQDLDYLLKNGPLYEAWIQKRDLPFVIAAPQLPLYGRDQTVSYLQSRTRAEIPERLAAGVPPRPPELPTPTPMLGAVSDSRLPYGPEGPPDGWSKLEADVVHIVEAVTREHRVDPKRRYLTGISYGAFGAWYVASRHPQLFAAIAPVVGWGHPDLMMPLAQANLPIWAFAGGRDTTIEAKYFYPGLQELESHGHSRLRFTIEADMGHDVWARVYAGRDLYEWLLEFSRDSAAQ